MKRSWVVSRQRDLATDAALLTLRLTSGCLLMGHGAQKLFGLFGGPGMKDTARWLRSMGLRPERYWSVIAGSAELGGGLLTALGLLNPVGPLAIMGVMAMASATVHRGKPIWVSHGGAELPVTNSAIMSALILAGPGRFSLDHALGLHLPRWVALPGLAAVGSVVVYGLATRERALTPGAHAVEQPETGVVAPT